MRYKWTPGNTSEEYSCPYLSVSRTTFKNDTGFSDDFYLLNFTDWVNVVPETACGEIVLVEIFRMGIASPSLELPGGQISSGIEPKEAARAELLEETGYISKNLLPMGWIHPNPAIQSNKCHFFVGTDCEEFGEQALEDAEDITVTTHAVSEIPELISQGKITHSLSAFALMKYYLDKQILNVRRK